MHSYTGELAIVSELKTTGTNVLLQFSLTFVSAYASLCVREYKLGHESFKRFVAFR
jgi:hypothetical protein